jgi:Fe-S-cluster containining protein
MQIEQTAPGPLQDLLHPLEGGEFSFACHSKVSCFTECCRQLNLLMTPYDVVRLKNSLGIDADALIEQYTDVRFDEQRGLPTVYLKMLDNERKTCPFVSPEGCRVYLDRPSACRTYPLARASRKHRLHGTLIENYFIVKEPHCKGFEEERRWTVDEWISDQGLEPYHAMNNLWMEIVTHPKLSSAQLSEKQAQMFFMASYNAEQFRNFVTKSRFLQIFKLDPEEIERIRENDEDLLKLAYRWLRFSLLNEPSLEKNT